MKWDKKNTIIAGLSGAVAAAALVAACGSGNNAPTNDLLNIGSSYPDYYANYMNVDGQPNIGLMCIHGAALITTSREAAGAAQPFPSLDGFCKTQIGSNFSRTGHF